MSKFFCGRVSHIYLRQRIDHWFIRCIFWLELGILSPEFVALFIAFGDYEQESTADLTPYPHIAQFCRLYRQKLIVGFPKL